MPLLADPDDYSRSLLCTSGGEVLARLTLRDDEGERVAAGFTPAVRTLDVVVAQARLDLAGARVETGDDQLAAAFVADGLEMQRASTTLRHDLVDLPPPAALPAGWSWRTSGWDDDLAQALAAAYGNGHPDGGWTANDTRAVRELIEQARPVPALSGASARVAGPDGRSAGHVLTAGPVPWTVDICGWVLNLAVAPWSQGLGVGRALLDRALQGTAQAGLPSLDLSVVDGGPARRLYDSAGFRVLERVLSVRLPQR
jgi:mycothiol synthase